jgi:hypothetical protein
MFHIRIDMATSSQTDEFEKIRLDAIAVEGC